MWVLLTGVGGRGTTSASADGTMVPKRSGGIPAEASWRSGARKTGTRRSDPSTAYSPFWSTRLSIDRFRKHRRFLFWQFKFKQMVFQSELRAGSWDRLSCRIGADGFGFRASGACHPRESGGPVNRRAPAHAAPPEINGSRSICRLIRHERVNRLDLSKAHKNNGLFFRND